MVQTLATKLTVGLTATQTNAVDLGTTAFPLRFSHTETLPTGTAANKADRLFTDTRTLAASASEDLDLAGVLTDAFGVAITFAKVKGILVEAAEANTNNVVVGPQATAPFVGPFGADDQTQTIKPGGVYANTAPGAGWPVTATTGDKINVANSGGTTGVTYKIMIWGTSV